MKRDNKQIETSGIVKQVKTAIKPQHRLATCLGFMLGGLVPTTTYMISHYEITWDKPIYFQVSSFLVLGGLLYSATTVFSWGLLAFGHWIKALGFVILTEGTLVMSHITWLSLCSLGYLVAINGVATGCALALHKASSTTHSSTVKV